MTKFNLIIIGGGAGAFATAISANKQGAKILMINDGLPLGGTCVNVGCVPSKTLLWASELLHQTKHHGIPGIELEVKKINFSKVVEDELNLVNKLRTEKYEKVLKNLKNVITIKGRAKFISNNEIEVNGKKFTAEKFIIATGSTANVPNIEGIRKVGFLTHIEALKLKKQPKELVIIGAGPVGLEFAQMFSRFGTKVTILQRGSSIFQLAEKELTTRLSEILTREGITIKTGVEVKKAHLKSGKKIVTFQINGKQKNISADEILLAAGKTPNTKELELKQIGVKVDNEQAIIVNKYFQTSQNHIYAVGDVNNLPIRLETTAGNEGTLAAKNAISNEQKSIDYNSVPYTIFTDPQLASVGFTEEKQLKDKGVCACRTISLVDVPKAIIIRQTDGLIKMGVDPKTGQILGVHILSPNASELIAEAMVLIKNKNTIDDVINSLPMFPTLSEGIKLVARSFKEDISKLSCCI